MRQPDIYDAEAIKTWSAQEEIEIGGRMYWRLCRPMAHNAFSWRWRFKMAWLVLTGQCDVVRWGK